MEIQSLLIEWEEIDVWGLNCCFWQDFKELHTHGRNPTQSKQWKWIAKYAAATIHSSSKQLINPSPIMRGGV